MSERSIVKGMVENCAPTLAGMKCAGLFNYYHDGEYKVWQEVKEINEMLNRKGVYVEVLIWRKQSALIYVYRKTMLKHELEVKGAAALLKKYGYQSVTIDSCIKHLKQRIQSSDCFPHEIGIFLGYPLEDVTGFINNGGKGCESCGLWKVYCNKEEKERIFQKYIKCKEVYMQVFYSGGELQHMTVCT